MPQALDLEQWGKCWLLALLPFVWRFLLHCVPAQYTTSPMPSWWYAAAACLDCSKKKGLSKQGQQDEEHYDAPQSAMQKQQK